MDASSTSLIHRVATCSVNSAKALHINRTNFFAVIPSFVSSALFSIHAHFVSREVKAFLIAVLISSSKATQYGVRILLLLDWDVTGKERWEKCLIIKKCVHENWFHAHIVLLGVRKRCTGVN